VRILAQFIIGYLFAAFLFLRRGPGKKIVKSNGLVSRELFYFIFVSRRNDASHRLNPIFDAFNSVYVIFENHRNYFPYDEIACRKIVFK
jgi:hypothetical protein